MKTNEQPSAGAMAAAKELWPNGLGCYMFDTFEQHQAAITRDWEAKARIIDSHPNAIADELNAALINLTSRVELVNKGVAESIETIALCHNARCAIDRYNKARKGIS